MKKNNRYVYDIPQMLTLRELLERSAELYAEQTAFAVLAGREVREVSYADFYADVAGLATQLQALGLAGKKIALIGKNGYGWALGYFAVTAGCGVVVPFDKEYKAGEVANLAADADIAAILYATEQEEKVEGLPESILRLPFDRFPEYIAAGTALMEAGDRRWAEHAAKIDPQALGVLIYTSGTTGVAKGVMLSQYNICSDLCGVLRVFRVTTEDRTLSVLPMHHTYECLAGFLCPLASGASISFNSSIRNIQADFARYQPTVFVAVPLLLEKLHAKIVGKYAGVKGGTAVLAAQRVAARANPRGAKKIFAAVHRVFGGRLRAIICGAAALSPEVYRDLETFGIAVYNGYGLTETAPVLAVHRDSYRSPYDVGPALPGVTAKIDAPNEEGIGELIVRGPNVMLGYYNNPDATAEVIRDGWFRTGDLARFDPKTGAYAIVGRCKTMIVTKNGKKIFPEEIEYYVGQSPYVAECMAFGAEGKDGDVKVTVAIYPDAEALAAAGLDASDVCYVSEVEALLKEAVKAANRSLPVFKHIGRMIIRREPFAKTTTQKIRRNAPENLADPCESEAEA
ncbi:MAG: AMP-binding protein [Clostridia bacterium]|nr:AMP-binding protein [Clostridia bacterium]